MYKMGVPMKTSARIEETLERVIARATGRGGAAASGFGASLRGLSRGPSHPAAAMPGGRARPAATAIRRPRQRRRRAAIELLHCASLVHDDLPCFDDADTRRGKPSVHAQFGDADRRPGRRRSDRARIRDFGARQPRPSGSRSSDLDCRRPPSARQAESWPARPGNAKPPCRLSTISAPRPARCSWARPWPALPRPDSIPNRGAALGEALGEAYQVADDLRDVLCDAEELGKPIGQDAARYRPNAAAQLGIGGAKARLEQLVSAAADSIPDCPGRADLGKVIEAQTAQLFPKQLQRFAA